MNQRKDGPSTMSVGQVLLNASPVNFNIYVSSPSRGMIATSCSRRHFCRAEMATFVDGKAKGDEAIIPLAGFDVVAPPGPLQPMPMVEGNTFTAGANEQTATGYWDPVVGGNPTKSRLPQRQRRPVDLLQDGHRRAGRTHRHGQRAEALDARARDQQAQPRSVERPGLLHDPVIGSRWLKKFRA